MFGLGIEFISVFGMPPVQLIELSAELGCQHITTVPRYSGYNPEHFPPYDLVADVALRREIKAALVANNISFSLGEGTIVLPDVDTRAAYAAPLDAYAELGIPRINVAAMGVAPQRGLDEMALLVEMAAERGMSSVLEFAPVFTIGDLPSALAALAHIGRDDCKLLIDTMHAGRTNTSFADIAALGTDKIGYIQLCDAPREPVVASYMEEAMVQRRIPGDGEMPLQEMLTVLPRDIVVGLEIPLRDLAEAGIHAKERMRRCVAATRALLTRLPPRE